MLDDSKKGIVRECDIKEVLGKKETKADDAPVPYHLWNDIIGKTYTDISKEKLD